MLNEYVHMGAYLLGVCLLVREIARYDSFIKIEVSISARLFLLIFSFERKQISLLCIVSQIYAYTMIGLFIVSRFQSLDFLYAITDDPNTFFNNLLRVHYVLIIPVAIIEEGICYIVNRISNRS